MKTKHYLQIHEKHKPLIMSIETDGDGSRIVAKPMNGKEYVVCSARKRPDTFDHIINKMTETSWKPLTSDSYEDALCSYLEYFL